MQLEYGPVELDLNLRARIHCLEKQLAAANKPGLVETNAGVRSVMIEYDARSLSLPELLALIESADASIGDVAHMVLPSRIVHLPMAFDERCVRTDVRAAAHGCCHEMDEALCTALLSNAQHGCTRCLCSRVYAAACVQVDG